MLLLLCQTPLETHLEQYKCDAIMMLYMSLIFNHVHKTMAYLIGFTYSL